jgi:hypothetical protein
MRHAGTTIFLTTLTTVWRRSETAPDAARVNERNRLPAPRGVFFPRNLQRRGRSRGKSGVLMAERLGRVSAAANRHPALPRSTLTPTLPQDKGEGVRPQADR